tara:strand:- start:575 stop:1252 length:678 start_codon:yes stop_codon:yes gene_type:complete
MRKEIIGNAELYLGDSHEILPTLGKFDAVVLDPPYDEWHSCPVYTADTIIAFTNHQNRRITEDRLGGKARTELIWHFADGRWVSPNLPRITHANILIYGETKNADVGAVQCLPPQRKGKASIGKDKLGSRIYTPKERKHINSVLNFPRNVSNPLGCFGKPEALLITLIEWIGTETWLDPFMGSGTTGVACMNLGRKFIGIEIEEKHFDIACERIDAEQKQQRLFA